MSKEIKIEKTYTMDDVNNLTTKYIEDNAVRFDGNITNHGFGELLINIISDLKNIMSDRRTLVVEGVDHPISLDTIENYNEYKPATDADGKDVWTYFINSLREFTLRGETRGRKIANTLFSIITSGKYNTDKLDAVEVLLNSKFRIAEGDLETVWEVLENIVLWAKRNDDKIRAAKMLFTYSDSLR